MYRASQFHPRRPQPELLNLRPAPILQTTFADPLDERVWAHLRWLHQGGDVEVEQVPARTVARVGDLVLCRWYEARLDTDLFWLHSLDTSPRGVWTD